MKRSIATRRIGWLLFLCVALGGIGGCGHRASVAGKVSYQNRPVIHGAVLLMSPDKTVRSAAILPDGSYSVENVPSGTVEIAVISRDPTKGRSAVPGQTAVRRNKSGAVPAAPTVDWFPLPIRFENPESSGLSCDVGSGAISHDIELKP